MLPKFSQYPSLVHTLRAVVQDRRRPRANCKYFSHVGDFIATQNIALRCQSFLEVALGSYPMMTLSLRNESFDQVSTHFIGMWQGFCRVYHQSRPFIVRARLGNVCLASCRVIQLASWKLQGYGNPRDYTEEENRLTKLYTILNIQDIWLDEVRYHSDDIYYSHDDNRCALFAVLCYFRMFVLDYFLFKSRFEGNTEAISTYIRHILEAITALGSALSTQKVLINLARLW
jgi:hypothetical protein